jgi:hypothetical protein
MTTSTSTNITKHDSITDADAMLAAISNASRVRALKDLGDIEVKMSALALNQTVQFMKLADASYMVLDDTEANKAKWIKYNDKRKTEGLAPKSWESYRFGGGSTYGPGREAFKATHDRTVVATPDGKSEVVWVYNTTKAEAFLFIRKMMDVFTLPAINQIDAAITAALDEVKKAVEADIFN